MDHISYKTKSINQQSVQKEWILIDAAGQRLGRLSSQIAAIIRGKHKAYFTPNADCGDKVIVINAEEVQLTAKKWDKKEYISHTGYPGGQKIITPRVVQEKFPTRIIEYAVKGMLPKNSLGRKLLRNLSICVGPEHKHIAQQPKKISLKY